MSLASLQEDYEELTKKIEADNENLNQFFLLIMGALVMFMQAGFAFLEAGAVRSKNVVNILLKNALDMFLGAIVYWAFGYAFAYGDVDEAHPQFAVNKFIGFKYFFSIYADHDSFYFASWFFQFVFAATASTIVSGAVAERTQFGAYLIYSMFITGFIYPVVVHWCWSGTGWLAGNHGIESMARVAYDNAGAAYYDQDDAVSYVDFAGSGIVHCCGGICALLGATIIGPRLDRYSSTGKSLKIPGHSVPIASLGAFILFLGFLAFNGGSELAIVGGGGHGQAVAVSFMNTILGGAAGAIFATGCKYLHAYLSSRDPHWSLLTCINGALCGMVSMCAGCNNIHQGAAFGIGAIAGITFFWVTHVLDLLQIDDPLDAFAVHYGGGVCGVLLTPVFMINGIIAHVPCDEQETDYVANMGYMIDTASGTPCADVNDPLSNCNQFSADNFQCDYFEYKTFAWNLCGLIVITCWAGVLSGAVFFILRVTKLLRVDEEIERKGLDIKKHGEPAYPTAAYGHGWEREGDLDLTRMHKN